MRVQELAGPAPLKAAFRAGLPEITSKDPDEPIFWALADLFWPASAFKDQVFSFKNRRHIKLISCAGFLPAGDGFKNHPAHKKMRHAIFLNRFKDLKMCLTIFKKRDGQFLGRSRPGRELFSGACGGHFRRLPDLADLTGWQGVVCPQRLGRDLSASRVVCTAAARAFV
ncbi:MAG: hypothetical protein JNL99_16615 [Zoogloea sp.]|nr:hypothetical protein [Zoogloea sp.]